MKKMKRFQNGGTADENFTAAQLEFLGGADRTDPYILARMRKAAPDAPKAAAKVDSSELRDETGKVSSIKRNTETGDLYDTESSFKPMIKNSPVTEDKKPVTVKTKEVVVEKTEPKKKDVSLFPVVTPSTVGATAGAKLGKQISDDFKNVSLPKSFKEAGGNTKPTRSTAKLTPVDVSIPDPLSRFKKQKSSDPAYKDAGYKKGGKVSSASRRGDGIAIRGKTRA